MALTRILRLSHPNHIRLVFPVTINRDSKTCSERLLGPFFRNFSSSDERVVAEDSVKSLRRDVELLRTEISLLSEVVRSIQKCNAQSVVGEKIDRNDFAGGSKHSGEKGNAKKSDLSEDAELRSTMAYLKSKLRSDKQRHHVRATEEVISLSEFKRKKLHGLIESEISDALDLSRLSCQGFNFPFKVEKDIPGLDSITLKRRYKSEDIVVSVSKTIVNASITAKNYEFHKSSNFRSIDFLMGLEVDIHCANSEKGDITYDCLVCSTGYSLLNVFGDKSRAYGDSLRNKKQQTEYKKYLEERSGITHSTMIIIFDYMLYKMNAEELRVLYKLKELLEAGKAS